MLTNEDSRPLGLVRRCAAATQSVNGAYDCLPRGGDIKTGRDVLVPVAPEHRGRRIVEYFPRLEGRLSHFPSVTISRKLANSGQAG
jgi:hypothetical protein